MPRLSFILPVYRTEKYLARCVKALVEQSFKDWQAVWVLDGPSDEAKSLIKKGMGKLKNYKIIEVEHGGASAARNAGAAHADGEFWCFFDSDCVIEPDTAQGWIETFDANPGYGFIYAGYKWLEEGVPGYLSQPFDPYLLKCSNYISSCFPLRRELFPGWNTKLESLQDWDFWLRVVEGGAKGYYMIGYAWSTPLPDADSISGQGCTPENWLKRRDAVKKLHNLPDRKVCVTSLTDRHEAIRLAKLINADFMDSPTRKPHRYEKIIQVGFTFEDGLVNECSAVFNDPSVKNYLFWTLEAVSQVRTLLSKDTTEEFAKRLNLVCTQFCEDLEAKRLLQECGFNVSVLPLPIENKEETLPMPDKPHFLVDASVHYAQVLDALQKSLPDIKFSQAREAQEIKDYTGLIHFYRKRTISNSIKRMLLNGRHVVSNIEQPFTGFEDDQQPPDTFIPRMVDRLRKINGINEAGRNYYSKILAQEQLQKVL